MMRRIPQTTIDQVLERVDIVDIVSNYVTLKRRGRNFFGICPFHKEKTGSFSVHPERQIFKCFGCGKGGTALTFVQSVENLTFVEAIRFLADKAGVRIEFEDDGRRHKQDRPEIDRTQVLDTAANQFTKWLMNSKEACDYLQGRGIDQAAARRFRLGYAPDSWEALHDQLLQKGIPDKIQEELGLIIPRQGGQGYYDRFRKRIIFPIANPLGRIVAFGGRALGNDEPKYLNSPETSLFNKSRTLYLLEKAREAIGRVRKTLVVEGYMDAIALHRFGYEHSVAALGTALTEDHARLLRRYGEDICLIYDGDEAGLLAARRGVDVFLSTGLPVRVAVLPSGEDPDSLLSKEGKKAMDSVLEDAKDGFEFCFDRAVMEFGLDSVADRRSVIRNLLPILIRIPEAVVQADYITFLAGRTGVNEAAIREDLSKFRRREPATRERSQS
ncbi:MAG: DNA primase, partial [bacterium]